MKKSKFNAMCESILKEDSSVPPTSFKITFSKKLDEEELQEIEEMLEGIASSRGEYAKVSSHEVSETGIEIDFSITASSDEVDADEVGGEIKDVVASIVDELPCAATVTPDIL